MEAFDLKLDTTDPSKWHQQSRMAPFNFTFFGFNFCAVKRNKELCLSLFETMSKYICARESSTNPFLFFLVSFTPRNHSLKWYLVFKRAFVFNNPVTG